MTLPNIERRRQLKADLLLLLVTLIWGGTFVMVKDATAAYPVFPFLAIRFGLATVALLLIGGHRLKTLTPRMLGWGALLGLFLFGGYAFQTLGLQYTTASKAGLITGLNVAIVPVLSAALLRKRPAPSAILGVALATLGMGLLSWSAPLSINRGDALVFLCAISFALHIVGVSAFAPKADPIALTILQVTVVTLLSTLATLIEGQGWPSPPVHTWFAAGFTGILATAVAFSIQTWAQRFTTPTHTALIFTAEPVFAALFGVWLAHDPLPTRVIIGGALILAGMLLCEIPWSKRTAAWISRFLAPQYVISVLLFLLAVADPTAWKENLLWVLIVGVPFILLMLGILRRGLRRGAISDWHISDRRERLQPWIVASILVMTALPMLILYWFNGPRLILAAALSGFLLVITNLIITTVWKISQHVSGIALGTTLITLSFGPAALPTLLLIPLMAWARVKVGAHTIAQTIAGGITGIVIPIIALRLLGLV